MIVAARGLSDSGTEAAASRMTAALPTIPESFRILTSDNKDGLEDIKANWIGKNKISILEADRK